MPRDLRIDTVRGLLLIMITLNHFSFLLPEGWWGQHWTWQPLGYVSAAEGFVFLAGFTFSSVSARYAGNLSFLWAKARENALRIYYYHLGISLSLAVVFWMIPLYRTAWEAWFVTSHVTPVASILAIVFLLHQPPYLDILPMYGLFVFFSPLAINLLNQRKFGVLFSVSAALWLVGQFVHSLEVGPHFFFPHYRPSHFNVFSWQLLYVLGLGFGNKDCRIVLARFFQHPFLLALVAICTLFLFLSRHAVLFPEITIGIDRPSLQLIRLVDCLCLATLASYVCAKMPSQVHISWLAVLGQHSLQVFSFHVVAFYVLLPFSWPMVMTFGFTAFVPLILLVTTCLWGVAFLHKLYQDLIRHLALPAPPLGVAK